MIPRVMGILNVTPDSFSDGGNYSSPQSAVDRAHEMVAEGAWIIDVGGESTRPGAEPVSVGEEIERTIPVVSELASAGVRVSIDTRRGDVAAEAVAAGATMINDVSASLWPIAARTGAGWIAMHMSGDPETMQNEPRYDDVVSEVTEFLTDRARRAKDSGVGDVWIDPGFGFGKTVEHNLALVANIGRLVETGFPVVLGVSRKATLGVLTGRSDGRIAGNGSPTPTDDRLESGVAMAVWGMGAGVRMIRTHDVRATAHAAIVVAGEFTKDAA